jgi:hypothetical protein
VAQRDRARAASEQARAPCDEVRALRASIAALLADARRGAPATPDGC